MTVSTTSVAVPAGEWTEVATGVTAAIIGGNPNGFRMAIGDDPPDNLTTGPIMGRSTDGIVTLPVIEAGGNVYLTPIDGYDFTANVIA